MNIKHRYNQIRYYLKKKKDTIKKEIIKKRMN